MTNYTDTIRKTLARSPIGSWAGGTPESWADAVVRDLTKAGYTIERKPRSDGETGDGK
jgi:hypothetical protein